MGRGNDVASRLDAHAVDDVAGGKRRGGIGRAVRQFARSAVAEIRLDVSCLRCGGGGLMLFQSPLLLGPVNHTQVVDASVLLRRCAGADEVRNGDGGQQADDRDHDHDFNQGEARLASNFIFHNEFCSRHVA